MCDEIFSPKVFHDLNPSGPLTNRFKYFQIRIKFCLDTGILFLCGVNDTAESKCAPRSKNQKLS